MPNGCFEIRKQTEAARLRWIKKVSLVAGSSSQFVECGNPTLGPMFKSKPKSKSKPKVATALNLNNVLNRMILPVLNRCETCSKEKQDHAGADHKYKRDASRPEWHGWQAFRRGLAANLHDLGVDDKMIQAILRHANVSMTQRCYIKTLPSKPSTP